MARWRDEEGSLWPIFLVFTAHRLAKVAVRPCNIWICCSLWASAVTVIKKSFIILF